MINAANETIAVLKDVNIRDPERHDLISRLLTSKSSAAIGGMTKEQLFLIVNMGKAMDDYDDRSTQIIIKDDDAPSDRQKPEIPKLIYKIPL